MADFAPNATYESAAALAQALQPDDPVLCFSAPQLTKRARVFLDHFPGEVSFAVKSNPSLPVLQTLANTGITHWDVASISEMAAVAKVMKNPVFHYHNPVKSRTEITEALNQYDCKRFAVDCHEELKKIGEVAGPRDDIEIAVRLVLPRERASSAHDFSTKFGAPEHICIELIRKVKEMGYIPLLTFHPGSQTTQPHTYIRHIEAAARIARGCEVHIKTLNVGGGFPANYTMSSAPEPHIFFKIIKDTVVKSFPADQQPELECEPGRGLVATCMSLLARVKLVCEEGDDIFINDGVYGALMEFMQAPDLQPPYRVIRDGKVVEGRSRSFKVFGPTCDPLDVLPKRLDIVGDLKEGDYIEFGTLGAYSISTLTKFNGYGNHPIIAVEEALTL